MSVNRRSASFYIGVSFHILLQAVIVNSALLACDNSTLSAIDNHKNDSPLDGASRVLAHLKAMPTWTSLGAEPDNKNGSRDVLARLKDISKESTADIRKAFTRFVSSQKVNNSNYVDEVSKIYVGNRYLFDVPSECPLDEKMFFGGGWLGLPTDAETVNLLWPLSVDKDGNIRLTGKFGGFLGPPYRPIDEFIFFEKRFNRRVLDKREP